MLPGVLMLMAFRLFPRAVQGEIMRGFVIMTALLLFFAYLVSQFSFWAAFGAMYMVGMIVVALVACFGRRRAPAPQAWAESTESDQV